MLRSEWGRGADREERDDAILRRLRKSHLNMMTSEQHLRELGDIRGRIPSGPTRSHKTLQWECAWVFEDRQGCRVAGVG